MSGKAPQQRELRIDRAVYVVDEERKRYRYLRRNHEWRELDPGENERNKRHLDGYTRVFPDGRTKVFRYRPPYTTRLRGQGNRSAPGD